ncbi:hypothetical protein HOW07_01570 [Plantibacter sp. MCCC 1A11337]|uniref:hypothetical protein n=1 Tax=Plantibacter TaxID=190323 RepID=UPI001582928B|nr:hypothetical protein [Plantibacter sp. MCCC 1A11337]NUJ86699.1 hypothetical protein [Plantibacter sp. MCCC 1A11337]
MAKRKTPEQIADEERRYELARSASTFEEFSVLANDPNQAIRAAAAHNPAADPAALELFLEDRFWGARIEIALHPNATDELLIRLLEADPRKRGVVHHEAERRLAAKGFRFDDGGLPLIDDAGTSAR